MNKLSRSSAAFGCLYVLAIIPLSTLFEAYVLTIMWDWYVVSFFHVRSLSRIMAVGLLLTGVLFRRLPNVREQTKPADDPSEIYIKSAVVAFFQPAFVLLFGWFWHFFL